MSDDAIFDGEMNGEGLEETTPEFDALLRQAQARPSFVVGLDIFLDIMIDGKTIKSRSHVVGWVPGEFIMVTAPLYAQRLIDLKPGNMVTMRYLLGGVVYGFNAELLRRIVAPRNIWVVGYPNIVESKALRRHTRLQTLIPVKIESERGAMEGLILDLSEGGSLISINSGTRAVNLGEILRLQFQLPDGSPVSALGVTVKNTAATQLSLHIGTSYDNNDPAVTEIRRFIQHLPAQPYSVDDVSF